MRAELSNPNYRNSHIILRIIGWQGFKIVIRQFSNVFFLKFTIDYCNVFL